MNFPELREIPGVGPVRLLDVPYGRTRASGERALLDEDDILYVWDSDGLLIATIAEEHITQVELFKDRIDIHVTAESLSGPSIPTRGLAD